MGKTEKWENIFWVTKRGNKGITNRGRFSGLQIREWGITNRGSFWDFKSGKKNYKSGQRDFKTEYRLQTGVRSISNWGRDYKSVKNKCDVTWFLFLFLFYSLLCTMQFLFYSSPERVGGSFKIGCWRWRGEQNFGCRWTGEWDVLKIRQFSWASYVCRPLSNLLLSFWFFQPEVFWILWDNLFLWWKDWDCNQVYWNFMRYINIWFVWCYLRSKKDAEQHLIFQIKLYSFRHSCQITLAWYSAVPYTDESMWKSLFRFKAKMSKKVLNLNLHSLFL